MHVTLYIRLILSILHGTSTYQPSWQCKGKVFLRHNDLFKLTVSSQGVWRFVQGTSPCCAGGPLSRRWKGIWCGDVSTNEGRYNPDSFKSKLLSHIRPRIWMRSNLVCRRPASYMVDSLIESWQPSEWQGIRGKRHSMKHLPVCTQSLTVLLSVRHAAFDPSRLQLISASGVQGDDQICKVTRRTMQKFLDEEYSTPLAEVTIIMDRYKERNKHQDRW
jgi:hypothetical protein